MTRRLCLNMIVKDEADRIARCLRSVRPWITSWCIVDTGSTDATREIVHEILSDLPGNLVDAPFHDFAQARNEALRASRRWARVPWDYLILMDADMELVVENPLWLQDLQGAAYMMEQRSTALTYGNIRLLSSNADARYIGSTHEYLKVEADAPKLVGAYFVDHADGSNRLGKFRRDIDLLKGELDGGGNRALFYLAQSYRDDGQLQLAAQVYAARALTGGFAEEAWHAKLSEARCRRALGEVDAFVAAAFAAWAMRPTRLEAAAMLTRHFRDAGLHEVVCGLVGDLPGRPMTSDVLFVERDAYGPYGSIAEDFSISGFYVPRERERAAIVCDMLATRRTVPPERQALARANLRHYALRIEDHLARLNHVAVTTQLLPPLEDGWHACNPSVAAVEGGVLVNVRAVNYTVDDGRYAMPADGVIRTRNFLSWLLPERTGGFTPHSWFELDNMAWLDGFGIEDLPRNPQVVGLEDLRLFPQGEDIMFSACVRQLNPEEIAEQYAGRISSSIRDGVNPVVSRLFRLSDTPLLRHEKNWSPIVSGLDTAGFLYDYEGRTRDMMGAPDPVPDERPLSLDHLRGSSQAIAFDGGWLAVSHEVVLEASGVRFYLHRFVSLDYAMVPVAVSLPFRLGDSPIQFVAGLARDPDDDGMLIMAYGVQDRAAYVTGLPVEFVKEMLR